MRLRPKVSAPPPWPPSPSTPKTSPAEAETILAAGSGLNQRLAAEDRGVVAVRPRWSMRLAIGDLERAAALVETERFSMRRIAIGLCSTGVLHGRVRSYAVMHTEFCRCRSNAPVREHFEMFSACNAEIFPYGNIHLEFSRQVR